MAREDYPWLCSTMKDAFACDPGPANNTVSKEETEHAEGYTTEAFGKYGLKFTYYVVSLDTKRDPLYGEDPLQQILRAFYFNGYTEQIPPNVLTYQLQGIWGEDILTVQVGRLAFKYWSTYGGEDRNTPKINEEIEPRIGDVVYLEPNRTFYEIVDVKYYTNAFGLSSQVYTLTLRVYKDAKYSIRSEDPTLSNKEDPIYDVAPESLKAQFNTKDPLMLNDEFKDIENSENVSMMDPRYKKSDPNKSIDPHYGW